MADTDNTPTEAPPTPDAWLRGAVAAKRNNGYGWTAKPTPPPPPAPPTELDPKNFYGEVEA